MQSASNWNSLFNPAGGVAYHLRALRHRRPLWQPFRAQLATWLEAWHPSERQLALVGPSAGYNLPFALLGRFQAISVFEPDPLACWLFARGIRRALGSKLPRINFIHSDHLVEHPEKLLTFLHRERAAVLFCNVLGQLVHLLPEVSREARLIQLKAVMHEIITSRSWASFHDRVSGPLAPAALVHRAPCRLSDEMLVAQLYDANAQSNAVELSDHRTEGYFPEHLPHDYFSWQIHRGRFHLIEAVQSVR